jgi:hypothetical protein
LPAPLGKPKNKETSPKGGFLIQLKRQY